MKLTENQAKEKFEEALLCGWKPASKEGGSCSCFINPPCSYCEIGEEYFDEFCEDKNIEIIECKIKTMTPSDFGLQGNGVLDVDWKNIFNDEIKKGWIPIGIFSDLFIFRKDEKN